MGSHDYSLVGHFPVFLSGHKHKFACNGLHVSFVWFDLVGSYLDLVFWLSLIDCAFLCIPMHHYVLPCLHVTNRTDMEQFRDASSSLGVLRPGKFVCGLY